VKRSGASLTGLAHTAGGVERISPAQVFEADAIRVCRVHDGIVLKGNQNAPWSGLAGEIDDVSLCAMTQWMIDWSR
jgi:hypothetical protein